MEKFEKLPRGAIPTPRHELAAASLHKPDASVVVPAAFLMWPTKTAMWGNDIFGDCVTVEEAFAKATASPRTFFTRNQIVSWARSHGFLNGATLSAVMGAMQTQGSRWDRAR